MVAPAVCVSPASIPRSALPEEQPEPLDIGGDARVRGGLFGRRGRLRQRRLNRAARLPHIAVNVAVKRDFFLHNSVASPVLSTDEAIILFS